MDELMKWATGICISSAVVCIVELFITDMALEKTVRYVLGALMLCSVIIPLGNVIGDFRSVCAFNQKPVDDFRFAADQAGFVIIKKLVAPDFNHEHTDGQGFQQHAYPPDAVLCNANPD